VTLGHAFVRLIGLVGTRALPWEKHLLLPLHLWRPTVRDALDWRGAINEDAESIRSLAELNHWQTDSMADRTRAADLRETERVRLCAEREKLYQELVEQVRKDSWAVTDGKLYIASVGPETDAEWFHVFKKSFAARERISEEELSARLSDAGVQSRVFMEANKLQARIVTWRMKHEGVRLMGTKKYSIGPMEVAHIIVDRAKGLNPFYLLENVEHGKVAEQVMKKVVSSLHYWAQTLDRVRTAGVRGNDFHWISSEAWKRFFRFLTNSAVTLYEVASMASLYTGIAPFAFKYFTPGKDGGTNVPVMCIGIAVRAHEHTFGTDDYRFRSLDTIMFTLMHELGHILDPLDETLGGVLDGQHQPEFHTESFYRAFLYNMQHAFSCGLFSLSFQQFWILNGAPPQGGVWHGKASMQAMYDRGVHYQYYEPTKTPDAMMAEIDSGPHRQGMKRTRD
jgi:hypothetical protein